MKVPVIKISVIIAARNEATDIGALIEYLRALPQGENLEIIVADGDSDDQTREVAERAGARVLRCQPNRGAQQNAAARVASGEILWFLHADARPHSQSIACLLRVMSKQKNGRQKICGGNFRLRFEADGVWPRIFEMISRAQRRRGIYYGDSGIWVRREVFDLLGGFREWPLFEDYDFARRLECFASRHGLRTEYSALPIIASARRFQKAPLRVLWQWTRLQMLFRCGVSPERLAALYFATPRR